MPDAARKYLRMVEGSKHGALVHIRRLLEHIEKLDAAGWDIASTAESSLAKAWAKVAELRAENERQADELSNIRYSLSVEHGIRELLHDDRAALVAWARKVLDEESFPDYGSLYKPWQALSEELRDEIEEDKDA